MYSSDDLDVWNLTDGGDARSHAVHIFNVVGSLRSPREVDELTYSINGAPPRPVAFNRGDWFGSRLAGPGHFNIDTLTLDDLRESNALRLRVRYRSGRIAEHAIAFRVRPFDGPPEFTLDLAGCERPEQVGQVIDGRWRIARSPSGRPCLEIPPDALGYDRIIAFGSRDWTTGYEVTARLEVTDLRPTHNVGILFKLNPHEMGDGQTVPETWSSGLANYRSYPPRGLRLRFGVGARRDEHNRPIGDHVLASGSLSNPRYLRASLLRIARVIPARSDLAYRREYLFHARIAPDLYALTVWPARRPRPRPQVAVADPPEHLLPAGCVGLLAHRAAVRLYEFSVRPVASGTPRSPATPTRASGTTAAAAPGGTPASTPP